MPSLRSRRRRLGGGGLGGRRDRRRCATAALIETRRSEVISSKRERAAIAMRIGQSKRHLPVGTFWGVGPSPTGAAEERGDGALDRTANNAEPAQRVFLI